MFQKILYPTDLDNFRVSEQIRQIAHSAEVTILHVIEEIRDVPREELADFYEKIERKAQEKLSELQEQFTVAGLRCNTVIVYGDRASEIVRYAVEHQCDLIAMESTPVRPEPPFHFTISHRVGLSARCAVLLLREPPIVA